MCNQHERELNPQHLQECTATLSQDTAALAIKPVHHRAPVDQVQHYTYPNLWLQLSSEQSRRVQALGLQTSDVQSRRW